MGVGLILSFRWERVLEAGVGFLDVPWHGEVDFPSLVVPLNYESAVSLAFPVAGAFEKYFRTVSNKC